MPSLFCLSVSPENAEIVLKNDLETISKLFQNHFKTISTSNCNHCSHQTCFLLLRWASVFAQFWPYKLFENYLKLFQIIFNHISIFQQMISKSFQVCLGSLAVHASRSEVVLNKAPRIPQGPMWLFLVCFVETNWVRMGPAMLCGASWLPWVRAVSRSAQPAVWVKTCFIYAMLMCQDERSMCESFHLLLPEKTYFDFEYLEGLRHISCL